MSLNPYLFVLSYEVDKVVAQKSERKDLVLLEAVALHCWVGLGFFVLF